MGRSAADRTYLSIREVLDLLVGEFPDVTISKIRFLESRGLIHPERTPSGYRKFYEHDVERLRWILRQQREHFLPLKVIKGRLENGPAPSLFDAVSEPFVGDPTPNGRTAVAPPPERASPAPTSARAGGGRAATDAPRAIAAPDAGDHPATGDDPATGADPVADDEPVASAPPAPASEAPDPLAAGGAVAAAEPEETPKSTEASTTAEAGPPEVGATVGVSPPEPAPSGPAAPPAAPPGAPPGAQGVAAPEPRPAPPTGAGVRFSADELAAAVDAEASLVDELISYGLLSARTVAGVAVYDEDDLALARIAAGLRRFGIEARHLRSFKHAAEREASLYGQVVTPLLRQRNPAAHERAERDLQELAELGGALRSVFLKSVLRELTGG